MQIFQSSVNLTLTFWMKEGARKLPRKRRRIGSRFTLRFLFLMNLHCVFFCFLFIYYLWTTAFSFVIPCFYKNQHAEKVSILIIYCKCEMKLGDRLVDHQLFLNLLDYWALLICFLFETYGTIVLLEFSDLEFSNTI